MLDFLKELGIEEVNQGASAGGFFETSGELLESYSPNDGKLIAKVKQATLDDYEKVVALSEEKFKSWRMVPAPQRGEIVRQICDR
ncbi:aldehyde dehydrogenase family protein, partial [Myxococcota bacterium]|nr:aldehyde dehydrogenase family protein [Myxococcota bacterium]